MMGDVPVHHHTTTTPFVGRDRELDQLVGLVLGADAPPPATATGVVLLVGDAGVGKTRLLSELGIRAAGSGWRRLVGHCLDFGDSGLPYLPFSEALGRLAQESPALTEAILHDHAAARHLMPGRRMVSEPGADDTESTDRGELFEAVHALLERVAGQSPLLLIVEDAHWADQSTRDLLSFLFTRSFSQPVSIVVSYRGDELHRRHPLRAASAQWSRVPGVHRLQLPPLKDADVRSLVRSIHEGPLTEKSMQTIVDRAEGNAFMAEELVVASELGGRALPDDLANLLLVRIDQLDDAGRTVVRAAACAGRQVSHELLATVVDLDATGLEQALRDAVEHHVLVPAGAGSYAFRHALLAEAVYDDLLPGERVRLHAAYVDALRDHGADGTAAELAHHARAAHDIGTAVQASIEAGDEAMAVGGPDEAARHYLLALELLSDRDSRSKLVEGIDLVALTARASDAIMSAGNPHRALALIQSQLAALPADAPSIDRARLLTNLASAALMGDTTVSALQAITEALTLVPEGTSKLRAKVLSVLARANADRQRDDEALRSAEQALAMGEQLGLRRVVADATTTLAKIAEKAGDPESSRLAFEKIVEQARGDGDVVGELRGLHHLGGMYFESGQLDQASQVYAVAILRAGETGRPWAPYAFDARVLASIGAYVTGDWEEVDRLTDVTGQTPPEMAEAMLAAVRLAVDAGRGNASALQRLPWIRSWWEKDGLLSIASGSAGIDLLGDGGDVAAAIRLHDDVIRSVTSLWQSDFFMARLRLSSLLLGQVASAIASPGASGRPALVERADQALEDARETWRCAERRNRRVGPEGRAWMARAEAEHLRVRWLSGGDVPPSDELVTGWRRTVEAFAEFGHVFELARSRARLAVVLRSLGEHAEAEQVAEAASAAARALGARPLLNELAAAGSHRAAASGTDRAVATATSTRRDAPLTPREREILALVAEGRSNSEIARRLYISAKTVSVHVSNVMAKLGAGSRTEAAAIGRRQGLVRD